MPSRIFFHVPIKFIEKAMSEIKEMAREFWRNVAENERVSTELKKFVEHKAISLLGSS